MKRSEEFAEFMKDRRSLADSIDAMPEIPEGLGLAYVDIVNRTSPIADNPYDKSEIREEGLKIWDSVFMAMPKSVSVEPKSTRDLASLRSINAEWESTKESLSMIGRPDGVHYLRPKGEMILDMMNDDLRMIQGAHILAHRHPLIVKCDDYTFGQTADVFLRSLIKLFIARKYGMKINVHPERDAVDSFSLYGIEVFGSTDLRAPTLLAPPSRLVHDSTVIAILGSAGIEAHPAKATEGVEWREINKWSCLPSIVALAGWECVDYIVHSDSVELLGNRYHAVPCADLQPMSELPHVIYKARESRGEPADSRNVTTVEKWFESDDFKKGLSVTPQLPCPYCLRMNDKANGVIRRPRTKKPRQPLKDIENTRIPELKEWVTYVKFVRNCIEIGRKATAYALGSVTSVRRRNSAFKKKSALMHKMSTLADKYRRKVSRGYISEAETINAEIDRLNKEIDNECKDTYQRDHGTALH